MRPADYPPGTRLTLRGICAICGQRDVALCWVQLTKGQVKNAICINKTRCAARRAEQRQLQGEMH